MAFGRWFAMRHQQVAQRDRAVRNDIARGARGIKGKWGDELVHE